MRKFIVQRFALDYYTKFAGLTGKFPRASTIIMPLFAFTGMNHTLLEYANKDAVTIALALPTLVALFFGFIYFRIKPVTYSELDWEQKLTMSMAVEKNIVKHKEDEIDWEEIIKYKQRVNDIDENKKFYKPFRFVFMPYVLLPILLIIAYLIH